ncbi:MAG: flagellar basal body P-ring formation protein FlgA [Bryobacterales bacterium]|nr:flagellar basal body P-ring formation protein FlgA [Bryobacterales bacterium]
MNAAAFLLFAWLPSGAACLTLHGDRITAGDLAGVLPAFSAVAPETALGYAPEPALTRVLDVAELRRLAKRYKISADGLHPVCVARQTRLLTAAEILSTLRALPRLAGARIELVDFLRAPVPAGKLELAPAGLVVPQASDASRPILWRGHIRYSATRTASFWVRFRALIRRHRVVAAAEIRPGTVISSSQLRVIDTEVSPFAPAVCETLECAAGKISWRSFSANEAIRPEQIRPAPVIARDDMVTVQVESGAVTIKITARAESGGAAGQRVTLVNQETRKRFQAIATGWRQARIDYGKEAKDASSKQAHSGSKIGAGVLPAGGPAAGGRPQAEATRAIANRSILE